ncbi:SusC/RagA family TonB-linked outer membrane protein [Persicitalea jodogahamensis]|uniref:SusC/RagA family TonB-linked outer membrane protein n=1 Tax=Persicitalea jodogahamensis TaxID=402147 RepID=A0A8J3DFI8_9BACT|nr:TonB-dependent receptor [Persicitalea jodogahamensis]GHB86716.1 SusC/RagA family TonB-linked outer membrane protein [Persicitalea jodogahamensis]
MKKFSFLLLFCLFSGSAALAQKMVSGVIKDQAGEPLPGATVSVQGTNKGTAANADGAFEISVNGATDVLEFSFVGYATKTITVGNQTTINVELEEDANALDEVVVVGYGTQKKSDITGAVTSVSAKTLEERPQVNIGQALQGTMPGVNISVNSNTASGASNGINIRGRRSISGGSDPLIVLDGVIYSGSLSDVNINDIQNLEVLKDASASAIYGARGANGVILITTKKGTKGGKPQLNFSTYYGVDVPYAQPDMMDAETFYRRKVERYGADFLTDTEKDVYASGQYADWVDLAVRNGSRVEHNLSVAGGTEVMNYFVSGNFQNVKGVAVNDDFSRASFRANLEINITDWLKLGTNNTLSLTDRSGISASFTDAFYMNPLTRAYNEDGTLTKLPWPEDVGFGNPLENTLYDNSDKTSSFFTNNYLLVDFPFLKGLSYRLNTGYTIRDSKEQTYRGRNSQRGFEANGFATEDVADTRDWLIENVVSYNRSFGKHNIFATALYSAQQRTDESVYIRGNGFPNDVRSFYQFNDAEVLVSNAGYSKQSNESQMLRLNYNYDSKYLLTITGRRDGYSAFGADTKYGLFPSVALGWNISDEAFLQNNRILNQLKLRLSYGQNGNQAISPYRTLASLTKEDYIDGSGNNLIGYRPGGLGNGSLGWETTTSLNLGIDFGLLNSRISGSLDIYSTRTTDLLLSKSIPGINGSTSIIQNIGETKGNGFELALNTRNIVGKEFTWSSQIAFSRNLNQIVNVGLTDDDGNFIDDVGSRWFVGHPISVNYGYVIDGIWQTDEVDGVNLNDYAVKQAGDVKYRDVNGDQRIDEKDRVVIGSLQPDFTLGFNNNFAYKGFSLDLFFYWLEGVTKRSELITTNDFNLRRKIYNVNYWSPTNPTNDFPENADRSTNPLSGGWYEDASFFRLKNVTLSYKIPQNLVDKLRLRRLEVYVNGQNLFTKTKWSGIDPEASDQTDRPFARTYLGGIRLGI